MIAEEQSPTNIYAELSQEVDARDEKHGDKFEYDTSFVIDPSIFLNEMKRIKDTSREIHQILGAMTSCIGDERKLSMAPEHCNNLEDNEKALFSPIPEYVAQIIDVEKQRRLKLSKRVQSHVECRQNNLSIPPRVSGECRAFVDPEVPLPLPYDIRNWNKEHLRANKAKGTYHNLFYGGGSECLFVPPQDNKRIQIEQRKKSQPVVSKIKPLKYEPPVRKAIKVPKGFVPSCAYVKKADTENE